MTDGHPHRAEAGPAALAAIVNFNGAERTVAAARSFAAAVAPGFARLLVIDNGSEVADVESLRSRLDNSVTIVELPSNGGYAAACNAAIAAALDGGAEFVLLLNNDLEFEDGFLDTLVRTLRDHPESAAAAPATVDVLLGQRVVGAGVAVDLTRGRVRHHFEGRPVEQLPSEPFEADALEASCLLVRAGAISRIGGFDEGFFMYWEDTEWSIRARRSGFTLLVAPDARVRHAVALSSAPDLKAELMIRNRVRFMRMVASPAQQAAFLTYLIAGWLPAYCLFRLLPRFGPRRTASIAARSIYWNVADARRRARWRLGASDVQVSPALAAVPARHK